MSNIPPQVICIGAATLDTIVSARGPLPTDGRILAADGAVAGGGPAATAAVALVRQGVSAALIGRVGDDAVGELVEAQLAAEGVDVSGLRVAQGATSAFSAVLVEPSSALRLILTHPGTYPPVELKADDIRRCRGSRWVHVDQAGWPAVRRLRSAGVRTPVSVDGGNPIPDLDLSLVTLYAPTEAALRTVSGTDDLDASMAWALSRGVRLVVVTRGAAGSAAMAAFDLEAPDADARLRDATAAPNTPIRSISEPAPSVPVVSTLGAGDVFHGVLLAGLCRGTSVRAALRGANLAAALSCSVFDGRSAIPDRSALDRALDPIASVEAARAPEHGGRR